MKKIIIAIGVVLTVAVGALAATAWYMLQPRPEALALPDTLIAADSDQGRTLLARSGARADHAALAEHFEAQRLASYCGVASSVIALNALGRPADQQSFFTDAASAVRGEWAVTFGGMSLPHLAGLLAAHGVEAEAVHAAEMTVDAMRERVRDELKRPGDILLLNYQRSELGQVAGGHISPLAAYDAESDRVLILDTAAHRYPPVWAELTAVHRAASAIDDASGLSRGLVSVRAR